jgi:uncharacterized protein DUF5681
MQTVTILDKIGYKSPPAATRFRRGQSGNPAGRPKRQAGFGDALLAELAVAMPGSSPDGARSKLQALIRTVVDSAIAGNARAQSIVIGALARIGDAEQPESPEPTPEDREILEAYVGGELQRRAAEGQTSKPEIDCPTDGEHERRRHAADQPNKGERE